MRVLITGARALVDKGPVWSALDNIIRDVRPRDLIVVHGDCPKGADKHARSWCKYVLDVTEERHPADWDRYGKQAGFIRNQAMVNLGADLVLAFLRGESRGTFHTVQAAHKAGLKIIFG